MSSDVQRKGLARIFGQLRRLFFEDVKLILLLIDVGDEEVITNALWRALRVRFVVLGVLTEDILKAVFSAPFL